jgi:hypothetical protein
MEKVQQHKRKKAFVYQLRGTYKILKKEEKSGKILHWRKKIKMKTFIIYMETFATNLQERRKKEQKEGKRRRTIAPVGPEKKRKGKERKKRSLTH